MMQGAARKIRAGQVVTVTVAIAATLILTACGSGGTESPRLPDAELNQLRVDSRVLQLEKIVERSDTLLIPGFHLRYIISTEEEPYIFSGGNPLILQGETVRDYLSVSCAGVRCVVDDKPVNSYRDQRTVISLQDLINPSADIDLSEVDLESRSGFDTVRTMGVFDISGSIPDQCGNGGCGVAVTVAPTATSYGLWSDDGFAAVEIADGPWSGQVHQSLSGRQIGDLSFEGQLSYAWAYTVGDTTSTNPIGSGSATWRGVAEAASTRTFERRQGTAIVTVVDLSHPKVGVEIDLDGYAIGSVGWESIPLANGRFVIGSTGSDYLEGNFHGPDHSETYGVFDTGAYIGVFGAKRD